MGWHPLGRSSATSNERRHPPSQDCPAPRAGTVMRRSGAMIVIRCETGEEVQVEGDDLVGAKLAGLDLHRALLERRDLRQADLIGADLRSAWLEGANLQEANLSRA